MERKTWKTLGRLTGTLILAAFCIASIGCRFAPVLIHAWKGHLVEAKYDGLEGRRVAVVCLSDANIYASELAVGVERFLRRHVPRIEIVPQSKIYAWQDTNEWDELDYQRLGEGIEADVLVAIELSSFRLYDGQTMYKGRATAVTTVYDVANGDEAVFQSPTTEHVFPANAAYATTDMSEDKFRRQFMVSLAREIAKDFHAYSLTDDFAVDPTLVAR